MLNLDLRLPAGILSLPQLDEHVREVLADANDALDRPTNSEDYLLWISRRLLGISAQAYQLAADRSLAIAQVCQSAEEAFVNLAHHPRAASCQERCRAELTRVRETYDAWLASGLTLVLPARVVERPTEEPQAPRFSSPRPITQRSRRVCPACQRYIACGELFQRGPYAKKFRTLHATCAERERQGAA